MHIRHALLAAAAMTAMAACSRTKDGDVVVDRPTGITTTQDTLHPPTIGTKTDTVNMPVIGSKKDTIVVDRPVVGTAPKTVKVPTIKKP